MGVFSFLTGKKDTQTAAAIEADRLRSTPLTPEKPVPTNDPVPSPAAPPVDTAPPPQDSTFHAPEAWNVDALTAPKPVDANAEQVTVGPADAAITAEIQPEVVKAIKTVFDPEIPVDIYELGLIYDISADADRKVLVKMTLTSPACPSAQQIPSEVRWKVKAIPGVADAAVEIVWEPPWDKDKMTEAAKLQLGFL
jgi:FeS assembly SUF system protein